MEKIKSFRDLRIWQQGIEIVKEIYLLTAQFPKDEVYGLTSQMKRAAISIPSNVAEGFKRLHSKEFRQFLHVALGSAAELETLLVIANELNLINEAQLNISITKLQYISKMISSLLNKLHPMYQGPTTKY